jgi:hypothetical protein
MSYSLSLFAGAGWQFFDNNGTILSGGKLYTYSAGSTSPLTTYTSSTATALNPNPIILDSAGRVPAEVWVNSSSIAKFVLKDANDVLIGTWDNIPSLVSSLNLTGVNNGVVYFNSVGTFSSGTNLTFDGTNLGVAGAATVGTNLNVAGPSALTGNVTASGALSVTGATTLNGALTTYGTATFGGTLSVAGNVINTLNVTGTLTTSGTTTLATGSTLTASPSTSDNSTKIATTAYVQSSPRISKAWVTFNGTTGAIRSSYNVSSVTRNSVGNYTINFTTPFSTADYCVVFGAGYPGASGCWFAIGSAPTASSLNIYTMRDGYTEVRTDQDALYGNVLIFSN